MSIFKRNKKVDPIDDRTDIERKFEETGTEIGKKAGKLTQKGINKFNELKEKLDDEGKLEKVYEITDRVQERSKEVIDKVTSKTKEVFDSKSKDE